MLERAYWSAWDAGDDAVTLLIPAEDFKSGLRVKHAVVMKLEFNDFNLTEITE